MKKLIFIFLILSSCVSYEFEASGNDSVYIVFEKGFGVAENAIMLLQGGFSHCYLIDNIEDSTGITTHPADSQAVRKAIIVNNEYSEGRVIIELKVKSLDQVQSMMDKALDNHNGYDYTGAIMRLGDDDKFFCSELVAYCLQWDNYSRYSVLMVYNRCKEMGVVYELK